MMSSHHRHGQPFIVAFAGQWSLCRMSSTQTKAALFYFEGNHFLCVLQAWREGFNRSVVVPVPFPVDYTTTTTTTTMMMPALATLNLQQTGFLNKVISRSQKKREKKKSELKGRSISQVFGVFGNVSVDFLWVQKIKTNNSTQRCPPSWGRWETSIQAFSIPAYPGRDGAFAGCWSLFPACNGQEWGEDLWQISTYVEK